MTLWVCRDERGVFLTDREPHWDERISKWILTAKPISIDFNKISIGERRRVEDLVLEKE